MSSSKKVILTGASGLIGKETLLPLKDAGFDIYALTIDVNNPQVDGVKWLPCNIFNIEELQRVFKETQPQYLLNLAWATTGDYLKSNTNFDFLNAGINMLKFFKENGGKRAVFAGTCFEYEFKNTLLKETDKINPQTVYAKCKNYLREIAELYCANNTVSFGWGRIFYVYGKNEHPSRLTAHVINSLRENKEVIVKSSSLIKDYVYSKDVAGAFVKLLDSSVEGSVNICMGSPISIKDYVLKIATALKKENLIKFENNDNSQPPYIVGDNSRLIKEVKYWFNYDFDRALKEVIT